MAQSLGPLARAALLAPLLVAGCVIYVDDSSDRSSPRWDRRCPPAAVCDTGTPTGPKHGLRADGKVDISASEAWPGRRAEPVPLTPDEVAKGCVALGACLEPKDQGAAATLIGLCALVDGAEERAIPGGGRNERRSFELRQAAASKSCLETRALVTGRPAGIVCEEDGCWWSSPSTPVPIVECAGTVARLSHPYEGRTLGTRDCARAWQVCDVRSPTGCTDRAPVACDARGRDRCDGDIKLGCDRSGRVSFHDCTRYAGGRCVDDDRGARCEYPNAGECTVGEASTCDGGAVLVCVAGKKVRVGCGDLGLGECRAGRCVGQ